MYIRYLAVCGACSHSLDLETESKSESVSSSKRTVFACKETGITYEELDGF